MTNAEVERQVREVVALSIRVDVDSIGTQVPFSDLGLDSVGALVLIERLEDAFDVRISDDDSLELTSIAAVVRYIAPRVADRSGPPRGPANV